MLNRIALQNIKSHKLIIMFILLMILLIALAWWVSQQLIDHLDKNMPGF